MVTRTKYRGFINYVSQVHNEEARNSALNFYGNSVDLGKSRKSLYTNNFTHINSISRSTEREIVDKFYENRIDLVKTSANDDSFNPDFPNGTVSYGYHSTQNSLIEIPIQGEQVSNLSEKLKSIPDISPRENMTPEENTLEGLSDNSGKYTPNLNVEGLGFQGQGSSARYVLGSGTGGFGNNSDSMSKEPKNLTVVGLDIHQNTHFGDANPNQDRMSNIRNDSVSLVKGVISIHEEGRLGSFSENSSGKDGGAYEESETILS